MNDEIVYKPHKNYVWLIPIFVIETLCFFMIFCYLLSIFEKDTLLVLLLSFFSAWATKISYDLAKITVILGQDEVKIKSNKRVECVDLKWEDFSYAYYTYSFKGFRLLVLSPRSMTKKEATKCARRCQNRFRVYYKECVVFSLRPEKKEAPLIETLVTEKLSAIKKHERW